MTQHWRVPLSDSSVNRRDIQAGTVQDRDMVQIGLVGCPVHSSVQRKEKGMVLYEEGGRAFEMGLEEGKAFEMDLEEGRAFEMDLEEGKAFGMDLEEGKGRQKGQEGIEGALEDLEEEHLGEGPFQGHQKRLRTDGSSHSVAEGTVGGHDRANYREPEDSLVQEAFRPSDLGGIEQVGTRDLRTSTD